MAVPAGQVKIRWYERVIRANDLPVIESVEAETTVDARIVARVRGLDVEEMTRFYAPSDTTIKRSVWTG